MTDETALDYLLPSSRRERTFRCLLADIWLMLQICYKMLKNLQLLLDLLLPALPTRTFRPLQIVCI